MEIDCVRIYLGHMQRCILLAGGRLHPPLNDVLAAAVALTRSYQCQAQHWLHHGLLTVTDTSTSCCKHELPRNEKIQVGTKVLR